MPNKAARRRSKADAVMEKPRLLRWNQTVEIVRTGVAEKLAYTAYRREDWMLLRTNNMLEGGMHTIRHRTHMVGALPTAAVP